MTETDAYDLVLIGSGPGGQAAALAGAARGARVLVVEERELGGTCLNRGCIPTKCLKATADALAAACAAKEFGFTAGEAHVNLAAAVARADEVVARLRSALERTLRGKGIELLRARGRLLGAGKVAVTAPGGQPQEITARRGIILAAGSAPATLPGIEPDGQHVLTSDQLLSLYQPPRQIPTPDESKPWRLVILGGGVIGCEFASIYSVFGAKVTLVEALDSLLPTMDEDIGKELAKIYRRQGIEVILGDPVVSVDCGVDAVGPKLRSGRDVGGDAVLVAVGRRVCSANLGLEAADIRLGPKGQVLVDERGRTNVAGVWAVGDLTGRNWLAHAAAAEGERAAADALGEPVAPRGPIPAAVFTRPEVGTVGLSEQEARARGPVTVRKLQYRALARAHTGAASAGELAGLIKLIAEEGSGKLLGAHLVGEAASELLGEATLAVTLGAKLADLAAAIHAHPTFAEGFGDAARG